MDIVAKHSPRLTLLLEKRRASEGYLHSVFVSFEQIRQETSLGVISTMRLVDKEYTLQVGAVTVINLHIRLVFFEFWMLTTMISNLPSLFCVIDRLAMSFISSSRLLALCTISPRAANSSVACSIRSIRSTMK